jgi:hypothetical protein
MSRSFIVEGAKENIGGRCTVARAEPSAWQFPGRAQEKVSRLPLFLSPTPGLARTGEDFVGAGQVRKRVCGRESLALLTLACRLLWIWQAPDHAQFIQSHPSGVVSLRLRKVFSILRRFIVNCPSFVSVDRHGECKDDRPR